MKKIHFLLIFLAVLTITAGMAFAGGTADENGASGDQKPMKIGFSISDISNPVWVEMVRNMQKRADELGVQLIVNDAKNDPNSQINAIENFIISGCQAIIVHGFNLESAKSASEDAMAKGVKVISYDVKIDGTDGWLGVANYELGLEIGKQAGKFINEVLGGSAEVGICEYPTISIIVERAQGIKDGLLSVAPNAKIVASATAGYVNEGVSVGENFLQAHPNMQVVAGINDGGILGVYEAFKAAGKTGATIGLFGCDATADALNAIADEGIYRSTIYLNMVEAAYTLVDMAYKAAANQDYQKDVAMGAIPITIDNVNDYL